MLMKQQINMGDSVAAPIISEMCCFMVGIIIQLFKVGLVKINTHLLPC